MCALLITRLWAEESLETALFCVCADRKRQFDQRLVLNCWSRRGSYHKHAEGSHFLSLDQKGSASVSVTLALFDFGWTWYNGWCVSRQPIRWGERRHAPKTKPRPPSEAGQKETRGEEGGGEGESDHNQNPCSHLCVYTSSSEFPQRPNGPSMPAHTMHVCTHTSVMPPCLHLPPWLLFLRLCVTPVISSVCLIKYLQLS